MKLPKRYEETWPSGVIDQQRLLSKLPNALITLISLKENWRKVCFPPVLATRKDIARIYPIFFWSISTTALIMAVDTWLVDAADGVVAAWEDVPVWAWLIA